ncbi:MAG: S9 family peptidase [Cyclobacteriaceae bacterium]
MNIVSYKIKSNYTQKSSGLLTTIFTLLLACQISLGQSSKIDLEDIYIKNTFAVQKVGGLRWMQDGKYFTTLQASSKDKSQQIVKYDVTNGQQVQILLNSKDLRDPETGEQLTIEDYSFGAGETKILLATQIESIYRRSKRAYYYIYDTQTKNIFKIDEGGKQLYATLSPDGLKVAYVYSNNLNVIDLASGVRKQITTDGKSNEVINGGADWVYEEEFYLTRAFEWSPDSKKIAFLRFDESAVREYNMQKWGELYPKDYRYKYPKAGEDNSIVTAHIYHVDGDQLINIDTGTEKDIYLPRIYWLPNSNEISLIRMNRMQNKLEILLGKVEDGSSSIIVTENSPTFVDLTFTDDLKYLNDGQHILRTSEKDGFKHIYIYSIKGKEMHQVTKGEFEVDKLIGIDEKQKTIYYTSTEVSPLERHLFSIKTDGTGKKQITKGSGVHAIDLSSDCKYFVSDFSSATMAPSQTLYTNTGKKLRILIDNEKLLRKSKEKGMVKSESFQLETEDGHILHGYILKPSNMEANKEYPLLMHVYGGPGVQKVINKWEGINWHQYLVQEGYVVACVDNRGTDGRGIEFKHKTYGQMGKYELEDQVMAAKYLGNLPYIDASRIAIWGSSYGGYMSSLALFVVPEVFKAAIAVAPVTNWRFYDTIYTERYLGLPNENPGGYDDYAPLSHTENLEGALLLIHGTGDDNVHFQHTIELQDALIKSNKQFETFIYPNRNHSISGGNTRHHMYLKMTDFLKRSL